MFRNVLGDLGLINLQDAATTIYNDNRGAVDWSNTTSTKGMLPNAAGYAGAQ